MPVESIVVLGIPLVALAFCLGVLSVLLFLGRGMDFVDRQLAEIEVDAAEIRALANRIAVLHAEMERLEARVGR